jgi:hypothetical protein
MKMNELFIIILIVWISLTIIIFRWGFRNIIITTASGNKSYSAYFKMAINSGIVAAIIISVPIMIVQIFF